MGTKIHVLLVRSHFGIHAPGASPHAVLDLEWVEGGQVPAVGQVVEVSAEVATFKEAFRGQIYRRAETLEEDGSRVFELLLRPYVERSEPTQFGPPRLAWSSDGHLSGP